MKVFIDWSINKGYLALTNNNGTNEIQNLKILDFPPNTEVYIESGCPKKLLYDLIDKGCKIFVVQGKEVAKLREKLKIKKTDKNDVKLIKRLHKENPVLFKKLEKSNVKEIKIKYLMGKYEILTKITTGFKNRTRYAEKEFGKLDFLTLHINALEKEKIKIIKLVEPLIQEEISKISIRGIGNTSIAKVLGQKHPKHFKTLSRWLAYCGYKGHVLNHYQKGKGKRPNYIMKSLFYWMAEETMKHRTPFYRELYDKCKERFQKEHPDFSKGRCHGMALNRVATFVAKMFWKKLHNLNGGAINQ